MTPPNRPKPHIVYEPDIRRAVTLGRPLTDEIEASFADVAMSDTVIPPMMQILLAGTSSGQTCIKAASVARHPYYAVKMSSIFPPLAPDLQSEANGAFLLFEKSTGRLAAALFDNGYLTQIRTAAAGAVATRHLAPQTLQTATIIGAGKQALLQAEACFHERPWKETLIWARRRSAAEEVAKKLQDRLGRPARAVNNAGEAAQAADLIVTTTKADQPILSVQDVSSGALVIAMGSDAPGKQELAEDLVRRCDLYVADHYGQCERYGELRPLAAKGELGALQALTSLGAVVSNSDIGPTQPDQITICDLTGVGVQDVAVGNFALKKIKEDTRC